MHYKTEPLSVPRAVNEVWLMDLMHDQIEDSKSSRLYNGIDDFNREACGASRSILFAC